MPSANLITCMEIDICKQKNYSRQAVVGARSLRVVATDLSNEGALGDLERLADRGATWMELSKCNKLLEYLTRYIPGLVEHHSQVLVLKAVLHEVLGRNWKVLGNIEAHQWKSPHIREASKIAAAGELIALPDPRFNPLLSAKASPDEKTFRQLRAGARLIPPVDTVRTVRRREPDLLGTLLSAIGIHLADVPNSRTIAERFGVEERGGDRRASSNLGTGLPPLKFTSEDMYVVNYLFDSLTFNPDVAKALFDRVAAVAGHLNDDKWRLALESHYDVLKAVRTLTSQLQGALQRKRQYPHLWAEKANSGREAHFCNTAFLHVDDSIAMFVRHQGTLEVLDDEIERALAPVLRSLYFHSPQIDEWHPGRKGRLGRLEADWYRLLLACSCAADHNPDETCDIHAVIRACQTYTELAERLLIRHLNGLADMPDSAQWSELAGPSDISAAQQPTAPSASGQESPAT